MREVEPWGGWELRVGWNPTPPRKPGSPGPLTPLKRIAGKGSFSVDGLQVARPVRCSQVRVRFCRVDILEAALSSPPSVRQSECLQALPDILRESAPPRCWRLEPRWPHGGPSIPAGEAGEPVCGGPDPGLLVAPLPPLPPGGRSRAARGPGAAPCPVPGLAPARSAHKGADAGAAGAGAVPERPPRRHPGLGVQPPAPEWRGGRGTAGGALGPSNLPRSVLSNEGTSGCDRRLRGRCWKGRKWRDSLRNRDLRDRGACNGERRGHAPLQAGAGQPSTSPAGTGPPCLPGGPRHRLVPRVRQIAPEAGSPLAPPAEPLGRETARVPRVRQGIPAQGAPAAPPRHPPWQPGPRAAPPAGSREAARVLRVRQDLLLARAPGAPPQDALWRAALRLLGVWQGLRAA
ncbi:zinc finger protein 444 isoform X4 [Onychomys torridus]|uniref:zinc finger protein 444 isoform X4 n=1 Tax=Onychomys torridus TaxID=38674 RepID=UPI00167FD4D4|nr:zinc finger protein 444 isoform X4 [Onychomys torridus]